VSQVRTRIRVTGTVQGVGFRPFVYALAVRLGAQAHRRSARRIPDGVRQQIAERVAQ